MSDGTPDAGPYNLSEQEVIDSLEAQVESLQRENRELKAEKAILLQRMCPRYPHDDGPKMDWCSCGWVRPKEWA